MTELQSVRPNCICHLPQNPECRVKIAPVVAIPKPSKTQENPRAIVQSLCFAFPTKSSRYLSLPALNIDSLFL